jgi:hypothetical protein
MSIIGGLLGARKPTLSSLLVDTQKEIFGLYGVSKPTDAQKVKAAVYLSIAASAILSDFAGGMAKDLIDQIARESALLTKPLRMLVSDLAADREDLPKILATFPADLKISGSTSINGLGAFDALYLAKAEEIVQDIWDHRDGPTGTPGYACIVLAAGIFGKAGSDKLPEMFMPAMLHINEFAAKLLKAM